MARSLYGIAVDVFGFGADRLSPEVLARVHEGMPRLDLTGELARIVVAQSAGRPGKTPPFTFPAAVVAEHVADAGMPTYERLVSSGPWGS